MRNEICDKRKNRESQAGNRKSPAAWYLCLALILLMYGLLFLFRSHIPEPWTALIAIGLLVVYRILRHWLHPRTKRTGLFNSSNSSNT
jgi:4-hydroxybenzoate polyprenyltransferase